MAARVTSGNTQLDEILQGGFPANSLQLVMGAPGSGKTILAEQLAFANGTPERPALYLTTFSEPLDKFLLHGQSYDFFDAGRVGESVIYEDLASQIRAEPDRPLSERIAELLARHRARLLVIDSFKALVQMGAASPDELFELASALAAWECTTFLLGEYAPEAMTQQAEFAVADGVMVLRKQSTGVRSQRYISVEKMRGSGFAAGMHAFSISAAGLDVFPRLITPEKSPDYRISTERCASGISGLDEMIEQGLWRGSSTLLAGPTGAGKTVIGLHFLIEGVRHGEPGLYVGFQENPVQLARTMVNFGWDPEKLAEDGQFEHLYRSPIEMELDEVVRQVFQRIKAGRIRRVVIDSLGDLRRRSFDSDRMADYLYALNQWFAVRGITSLMLLELPDLFEFRRLSEEEVSNMSDNVLLLRFTPGERMTRSLRIVKTRNSGHDHLERELTISASGVEVNRSGKTDS
jgi:circadian clock protein KaiC